MFGPQSDTCPAGSGNQIYLTDRWNYICRQTTVPDEEWLLRGLSESTYLCSSTSIHLRETLFLWSRRFTNIKCGWRQCFSGVGIEGHIRTGDALTLLLTSEPLSAEIPTIPAIHKICQGMWMCSWVYHLSGGCVANCWKVLRCLKLWMDNMRIILWAVIGHLRYWSAPQKKKAMAH